MSLFCVCHCGSVFLCVGVFRECGGARCVLGMVQYRVCRSQSLGIVQQLILSNGGEEDFAALLGLMHTSSPDSILLKMDIIKVIHTHVISLCGLSRNLLSSYLISKQKAVDIARLRNKTGNALMNRDVRQRGRLTKTWMEIVDSGNL